MATLTETRIAQRYIPRGYELAHQDDQCHIYFGEALGTGKLAALAFRAKAKNSYAHYSFKTEEARKQWLENQIAGFQARAERVAERKQARKEFKHGYAIGDILDGSWGYEQTNWSYYQVVAKTDKTVTLREIAGSKEYYAHEQYKSLPIKDHFIGDPEVHKVTPGYSGESKGWVNINSYLGVSEWDGKDNHGTSWY